MDGAEVFLSLRKIGLFAEVKHLYFDSYECSIRLGAQSELYLFWHDIRKKYDAPSGMALTCLQRMIKGARALNLRRIELWAGGSYGSSMNGYYTWARLGFDAQMAINERRNLPDNLRGVATLNELIRQGGANWWREHGNERKMIFDLAVGSSSEMTLRAYIQEKKLSEEF